ncbi:hypothetical protein GDO81_002630 [Engystomops pustulosus]|uniref:Uncharacterized protein n=1 Tax=Engystomops pustulosus TaxID=76066 RepID=A0AAV7DLR7_ENGPU|nr:hypothetical protein GDO81_002630 [Engystomops pustulosus]
MDLININELTSYNPFLQTYLSHIDFEKTAAEINEKHKKIREQQPKGPICTMRSEAKRLRSLLPLNPKSTWSPKELASAGFFNTGVKDSCQCFCCGLVFCTQSLSVTPIEKHKKFNPDCAFIQGIDVGNISKYDIRPQSIALSPSDHRMQDVQARLQTFSCWPPYTFMEPDILAQAGLFFTGTRDHVQCFSCGGCLGNWEENDDPWKEHAKWFPECEFLQGKKSTDEIQQYSDNYNEISKGLDSLKEHLIEKYHDRSFQHVSPFGDTISVDLDSQFADICDSTPKPVEELILKNPWNRLNLAVTVSTDKGRKLRQYARTIMSIQKFPLYSSIYLAKKLFPHDIERVRAFFAKLETSENLAAIFEIPLIILLQCSFWIRYPSDNTVGDIKIFKEYIKYNISKFSNETLVGNSMVSLCGELSLNGLFQSQFQFTDNDLRAASVDGDRAIKYGLLSKFTAQRLQSTYRFYSTSFQEFLAGKRLCELLESENPGDLEKGLHYLHQINTFLKIIGCYRYFLNYATRISTKATLKIFSYLFSLYDKPEALDCHLDSTEHLQRHPDLEIEEMIFIMIVRKIIKTDISSICMNLLMASGIEAAVENKCLPDCAPIILQFMVGKTMSFSVSPFSKGSNLSVLYFIEKYPKCITLFSSVKFEFALNKMEMENKALDFPGYLKAHESYGIPTVDEDYSSAYQSFNKQMQEIEKMHNESFQFFSLFPEEIQIDDSYIRPFTAGHKVPLFIMETSGINNETFSQSNSEKIQILFLMSDRIEMHLTDCKGFVKGIGSAINQLSRSFKKIVLHNTSLEEEEQDIILKMTSLESLEIRKLLVRGIHKLISLEEVSIVLPNNIEIIDSLSDEFHTLKKIRKIVLQSSDSTTFVNNIQSFEDLEVLHLHLNKLRDCNDLINSLTTFRKLKDLDLHETPLQETSAMRNFTSLKILNLMEQKITAKDVSESFAMALGSLCHLEKLVLPVGDGMAHAAKLIIKQLCNLPNLQFLKIMEILDDESIALLAEEAKNGTLKKLRELELLVNFNITESGWTTFFEEAEQMPELYLLDISRMYTQQIKSHATTVKSFVRLVSRLPSLVSVKMFGWLLDEDDLNMFNAMKQNHPQSKSLNIYRQWFLPFSPNIEQ